MTEQTTPRGSERLIHIHQGECRISEDPRVVLTTMLGSCIAACLRDPIAGAGGMNHFLLPDTEELFRAGWAVTWNISVGSACNCDTYLITEEGPRPLTAAENWPVKRIRIQGAELICPDVLLRDV